MTSQLDMVADRIATLTGKTIYRGQSPDILGVTLTDEPAGPRPSNVNKDYDYPSFTLHVRGTNPAAVISEATSITEAVHLDRHEGQVVSILCGMPDIVPVFKSKDHMRIQEATASIKATIRRNIT